MAGASLTGIVIPKVGPQSTTVWAFLKYLLKLCSAASAYSVSAVVKEPAIWILHREEKHDTLQSLVGAATQ